MPLSVISGLLSAISWGTGDFLGGLTSKRSRPLIVATVMQIIGAAFLLILAIVTKEGAPTGESLAWSVAAGIAGGIALLLLYSAFATGKLGIAAPVSGVVGASIPIVVAAITEGTPTSLQFGGFLLALAAVWLLAGGSLEGVDFHSIAIPVIAGVGFGLYYVLVAQAGSGGFFWPLTAQRTMAFAALAVYALIRRQSIRPPRALLPALLAVGIFDTGGNIFYLLAATTGRIDTAAVLSSLYPAMTVFLAHFVLHEQLGRSQWVGVILALAAIPLIVA